MNMLKIEQDNWYSCNETLVLTQQCEEMTDSCISELREFEVQQCKISKAGSALHVNELFLDTGIGVHPFLLYQPIVFDHKAVNFGIV